MSSCIINKRLSFSTISLNIIDRVTVGSTGEATVAIFVTLLGPKWPTTKSRSLANWLSKFNCHYPKNVKMAIYKYSHR